MGENKGSKEKGNREKVVNVGGKSFILRFPSPSILDEAIRIEKISYSNALRDGALTYDEAIGIMKKRGILREEDEVEQSKKVLRVAQLTEIVEDDSLPNKKRVDAANEIRKLRSEIVEYNANISEITQNTAEAIARDDADIFLIANTIFDSEGNKLCKDASDLRNMINEDESINGVFEEALYFIKGFDTNIEDSYVDTKIMKELGYEIDDSGNWYKPKKTRKKE